MKAKANRKNSRKRFSLVFIVSLLTALILISAVSCGTSTASTTLEITNSDFEEEHIENDMLEADSYLQSSLKSGYSFTKTEDKNLQEADNSATEPEDQTPPENENSATEPKDQTPPEDENSATEPKDQTPPEDDNSATEPANQTPQKIDNSATVLEIQAPLEADNSATVPEIQIPPEDDDSATVPEAQTPPEDDDSATVSEDQPKTQMPIGSPIEPPNVKPKKISVRATAYCPEACCNGKYAHQTASGAEMTLWHTVAGSGGDSCYLPLGTILYIPYFADQPNGGWFVVEDRFGSKKTEYAIDILMANDDVCNEFGTRYLEVYVYFV